MFAAMGVKYDVADFFRRTFEETGVSEHVAMFINLANDPVVERLITPKVALTLAEYLAFEKACTSWLSLTDMTSYAEAMREVSSSKGEIPSRKVSPATSTASWPPSTSARHRGGTARLRDPDSDSDHAERRYHPPDPRPYRGISRRGRSFWTARCTASPSIRPSTCFPACPV